MHKGLLAIVLILAVGLAAAGLWLSPQEAESAASGRAGLTERIAALEAALSTEREARQILEDELFELIEDVENLRAAGEVSEPAQADRAERDAVTATAPARRLVTRSNRANADDRVAQLTAAGFSPDRAEFIARREAELRLEAMQARFEARQAGEAAPFFQTALAAERTLRDELGEAEYEQYLEASNRPTAVSVRNVMELSPAEQAGLQPGDQIVRYNGSRVYNIAELNQLQVDPSVGDSVVVDILRDGVPMQVTLPKGPLGIMAGRRR